MDSSYSFAEKIDLHMHTKFSDGTSSVEEVVKAAEVKGLKVAAVTDHFSEFSDLPKRMSKRSLMEYLSALEGFKLLKGVEAEIFDDGSVSISGDTLTFLDVVIGGLHSVHGIGFWGDPTQVLDQSSYMDDIRVALIEAMESRKLDIIAHVMRLPETLLFERSKVFTDKWIQSIVRTASDYGVAVELSGAWKIPDERFVAECLRQGVKLSLGSDAHNSRMVGETSYGIQMLKRLKIDKSSIFIPKKADAWI